MRFIRYRRRRPPTVIIVSLIDVLLVVLIFLMVTTTAKKEPPAVLKLALPESKQAQPGATETRPFVVTVVSEAPHLWLGEVPVTLDRLQTELLAAVQRNPRLALTIKADKRAPWGEVVRVIDAAKVAQVASINAVTEKPSP